MDSVNAKVSIIIPVYNMEKYLDQCLNSVINQTLYDVEIILLNDGSTDSSYDICKSYSHIDNRIKLYSHENKGLGETRNSGIDVATGDYLFFVDSDDYLSADYVESLYKKALEADADIVQGESRMFFEDSGEIILEADLSGIKTFVVDPATSTEFMKDLFFRHIYKHYAWNKIYRTSFVKKNNIRFGDNKRIFAEDTWFQLQTFHYRPVIAFCSGACYYYRQRSTSIMHTPKKNLLKRQGLMIEDYAQFLRNRNGSELEDKICSMIAMDVFTMEALNVLNIHGNFKDYRCAVKNFRQYTAISESVMSFSRMKAYQLEANPYRRKYMQLISAAYRYRLDWFAQIIVWWTYKLTRGK